METEKDYEDSMVYNASCIFRPSGAVCCNTVDIVFHKCDTCGWNPEVEIQRIKKARIDMRYHHA